MLCRALPPTNTHITRKSPTMKVGFGVEQSRKNKVPTRVHSLAWPIMHYFPWLYVFKKIIPSNKAQPFSLSWECRDLSSQDDDQMSQVTIFSSISSISGKWPVLLSYMVINPITLFCNLCATLWLASVKISYLQWQNQRRKIKRKLVKMHTCHKKGKTYV